MELDYPARPVLHDGQTDIIQLTRLMDGWTIHNKVNMSKRFNACSEE